MLMRAEDTQMQKAQPINFSVTQKINRHNKPTVCSEHKNYYAYRNQNVNECPTKMGEPLGLAFSCNAFSRPFAFAIMFPTLIVPVD